MVELITDDEIIAFSWKLLARNAKDPTAFQSGLRAFAQENPQGFQTLRAALKAAGLEITSIAPSAHTAQTKAFCAPEIGRLYDGKGVYVGDWQITNTVIAPLYVAADFERDGNGEQIQQTLDIQKDEFAERNGGRTYGNGCVAAIGAAIVNGSYCEGDCFHGPLEFLNGKDIHGNRVRDISVFSLLKKKNPAFANILKDIKKGESCWAFSGTEEPTFPSTVYDVSLRDGDDFWQDKYHLISGVLPFRAFGVKHLTL
jgi:hypothetical protein